MRKDGVAALCLFFSRQNLFLRHSTFIIRYSLFLSFFFDQTGRSRPAAALIWLCHRGRHTSPFVEVFDSGKKYVFYCTSGGCSVPAMQQVKKIDLEPVCHIGGGFSEWKYLGAAIEEVEKL
jgi:rhodanese-related sulfurtransferase